MWVQTRIVNYMYDRQGLAIWDSLAPSKCKLGFRSAGPSKWRLQLMRITFGVSYVVNTEQCHALFWFSTPEKNVISSILRGFGGFHCKMTIAKEVAAIKVLWSMGAHLWSVSWPLGWIAVISWSFMLRTKPKTNKFGPLSCSCHYSNDALGWAWS